MSYAQHADIQISFMMDRCTEANSQGGGRRGFDSLVILVCWIIWKERNDRTFDRCVRMIDDALLHILDEITAWSLAGFRQLESAFVVPGVPTGREVLTV